MFRSFTLFLVALSLVACTAGTPDPTSSASLGLESTGAGTALAGADGRTLYINRAEDGGQIACSGDCTKAWPPLLVGALDTGTQMASHLGSIKRPDGNSQVTYDGHPLYYYAPDSAPGQTRGQGIGGVWFIAVPALSGPAANTPAPYLPSY